MPTPMKPAAAAPKPVSVAKTTVPLTKSSVETPLEVVDMNVVNTIIGYGESGLGKSTEARRFAQWLYERTGKPLALVFAEPSSQKVFEGLIRVGIVRPFYLLAAESPLAALRKLGRGQWPMKQDGKTVWRTTNEFSGYIGEGLTSIAEAIQEEVRDNHWLLREQAGDAFEIGREKFAPASRSGYGFVQSEMLRAIKAFAALPVERNMWTAHESKGKEEDGGAVVPIYGPALVGTAKTGSIQKYCGLLIHYENYAGTKQLEVSETTGGKTKKLVAGTNKIRAWFTRHQDIAIPGVFYPAKTTIPVTALKGLYEKYPDGFYEPTIESGIEEFLTLESNLLSEDVASLEAWKKEVDAKFKKS